MSATGSAFKDWNADEAEMTRAAAGRRRALLVDDDFSWSDPLPARQRPAVNEPARRATAVAEPEAWDAPLNVEHELDDAWGGSLSMTAASPAEVASWDDSMLAPVPMGGPRTVVITGHGAERQIPLGRRQRQSELRIHERSGFSPDRVAMWAFLLGVALVLGAIIH